MESDEVIVISDAAETGNGTSSGEVHKVSEVIDVLEMTSAAPSTSTSSVQQLLSLCATRKSDVRNVRDDDAPSPNARLSKTMLPAMRNTDVPWQWCPGHSAEGLRRWGRVPRRLCRVCVLYAEMAAKERWADWDDDWKHNGAEQRK